MQTITQQDSEGEVVQYIDLIFQSVKSSISCWTRHVSCNARPNQERHYLVNWFWNPASKWDYLGNGYRDSLVNPAGIWIPTRYTLFVPTEAMLSESEFHCQIRHILNGRYHI